MFEKDAHLGITSRTPEASLQMEPIQGGGKINPDSSDKISYTWSDVNVFAATQNERFWKRMFWRNSTRPVQQKHLLKDGKFF